MSYRLQLLNGSAQTVRIFWLRPGGRRERRGALGPGAQTTLAVTRGQRFVLVGRTDRAEALVTSQAPVQAFRFGGVPAFYARRIRARGFPIVASARVSPFALREAAYVVDLMLAHRPALREAMIRSGARLCILACTEFTTDQPEFAWLASTPAGRDFWDARARGLGGSETDPFCSCAEENLLGYPGDPYAAESILIHEFAHSIHLRGLANWDPTFDRRLERAFRAALAAGRWKNTYAATDRREYFAEGAQSWFDANRESDRDHNHVDTREELIAYDPGLAALCREVFGEAAPRYTRPRTRLVGHLAGYDPARAPTFVWPERLAAARAQPSQPTYETRQVRGWAVFVRRELRTGSPAELARALDLLDLQLAHIQRVVPAPAVAELQKVPLYLSPPYAGVGERAEYHPDIGWLRAHGRDPAMARAVEFTNVRIFDAEVRRMPVFVLHELAHAYHDRALGFDHAGIRAAYERAKARGAYDRVERQDADGGRRMERAYALTDAQEYFAETTEAFFGRNDFFPYTREQLRQHDPEMFVLLGQLWGEKQPTPSLTPP